MQLYNEEEKRKMAEEGLARRELEHKDRFVIFFNTNQERLDALKRWFPLTYERLLHDYPWFCENPDDYPAAVISAANRVLQMQIPYGSFGELKFSPAIPRRIFS